MAMLDFWNVYKGKKSLISFTVISIGKWYYVQLNYKSLVRF